MKKSILILSSLVLFALNTFAQNTYNLVLFSEDGEGFYAFTNGIRQNDKPETNVKITGLTSEALSLRIEFANKALPLLKKNFPMEVGFEYTVKLKKDLKKQMKMQYFGQVAIADAPKTDAATVQYHTAENPISTNNNSTTQFNTSANDNQVNSNTSVTTTSTSTQINTGTNGNTNGVGVNVNGLGININVTDPTLVNHTTTHSTTSSTVTSSSSSNSSPKNPSKSNPTTMPVENTQPVAVGCKGAMNDASFQKMKKSVDDKPFSDTKMSTAKVATKNACLSSDQIKDICGLFSMDDDKLIYAKYAYNSCVDKANFYHVGEIFSFSTTTDDLNTFIEKQ